MNDRKMEQHLKQPLLDLLKVSPIPDIAAALRAGQPSILRAWRKTVLETLPQADELTLKQLENSVPALLRDLCAALSASEPEPTDRLIEDAPGHGEARFHQNFKLNELLIEYHLLRTSLLEELARQLDRPLKVAEIVAVNSGIDVALREAAVAFADQQAQELLAEASAMTKYLSFLSHDLRGGLNSAILMVEVLRRELAKEDRL
ncbi:MAG: RsbRD N-terminal domain-containing protein, partial [Tepidisphaeraceae bacterium]